MRLILELPWFWGGLVVGHVEQGGLALEAVGDLQKGQAHLSPGVRRDPGRSGCELEQEALVVEYLHKPGRLAQLNAAREKAT